MTTPIRAITFDFWRTLYYAHSNLQERRDARVQALIAATSVSERAAKDALKHAASEFLRVHIVEQRTLLPHHAVTMVEEQLALRFEKDVAEKLAHAFAQSLVHFPPQPLEDALEAVRTAAKHVPIGLISDTGITPGSAIETLLDQGGFLEHFSSLTFSDVVGVSKPNAAMYHDAAHRLGVETSELLHIGDLEPTDIAGALNVGARAALFAGDNNRFADDSKAHHTFHSWREFTEALPSILN